jgi:hypothetical protein
MYCLLIALRPLVILFKQELFVILMHPVLVINVYLNYSRQFLVWVLQIPIFLLVLLLLAYLEKSCLA